MQIDWFTFVAQILNFLILLALLWRFLYRPVLAAVDRREEEIGSRLEEAEGERETARQEARRYREKQEELEERRAALIREAEEEAERRRRELHDQIRDEADQVREAWRQSVRHQREDFLQVLRTRLSRRFYDGMRKAVGDLADAELENRVVEVFLRRLGEMPEGERERFAGAVRESGGAVRVRSAFPLPEERREEIDEAVERLVDGRAELEFEEEPELGVGVEMTAGDRRVGWSAESYLRELEAEAVSLLEAEAG